MANIRRVGAFRELTGDPDDYTQPESAISYLVMSAIHEYVREGGDLQHFEINVTPARTGSGTGIVLKGWAPEETKPT